MGSPRKDVSDPSLAPLMGQGSVLATGGMRTLLYSPDSYGLGHVRRSVAVARAILDEFPGSSARLLTGAPRAHYFDYPDRCDYLKLPAITKDVTGRYVSRDEDDSHAETVRLPGQLIRDAAAAYRWASASSDSSITTSPSTSALIARSGARPNASGCR